MHALQAEREMHNNMSFNCIPVESRWASKLLQGEQIGSTCIRPVARLHRIPSPKAVGNPIPKYALIDT